MTQTLLTLLQNSRSLSDADKKRLAEQIPTMSAEELQTLENTLVHEATRAQEIDDKHQTEALALNQEYEQTVTDFNTHTIKNIRASTEEKKREEDLSRADGMLGSI